MPHLLSVDLFRVSIDSLNSETPDQNVQTAESTKTLIVRICSETQCYRTVQNILLRNYIWSCQEYIVMLFGIDTFSRETILSNILLPSGKGYFLKSKEFAPLGNIFFPFRVNTFSEGDRCIGKHTRSQPSYSFHYANKPIQIYYTFHQ